MDTFTNSRNMIIDLVDDSDDGNHKDNSEHSTNKSGVPGKPSDKSKSSFGKSESIVIYDSDDPISPPNPMAARLKSTPSAETLKSTTQINLPILSSKQVEMEASGGKSALLPAPSSTAQSPEPVTRPLYLVKSAGRNVGSLKKRTVKPVSRVKPTKADGSADNTEPLKEEHGTANSPKTTKEKTGRTIDSDSSSSEGIKGSAEKIARSRKVRRLLQSNSGEQARSPLLDSLREKSESISARGTKQVVDSVVDPKVSKNEQSQSMTAPPTASSVADQQVQKTNNTTRLTISSAEKILKKYTQLVDEDHEYLAKLWMSKARSRCQIGLSSPFEDPTTSLSGGISCVNQAGLQNSSPFRNMKGLSIQDASKKSSQPSSEEISEILHHNGTHSKPSISRIPVTLYKSTALDIPPHVSYISLKDSVIAENNRKLVVWPYFENGQENEELNVELKERYTLGNPEGRTELVKCLQRVQQLRPYILQYLEEVESSLDDIVRYFKDQPLYSRLEDKPIIVPATLHDHVDIKTANAGIISAVFYKTFNFSMWHIVKARYEELAREQALQSGTATLNVPKTCRVCNLHDCQWHGEIRDLHDVGSDVESVEMDDTDVNHKVAITQRQAYRPLKAADYAYQSCSGMGRMEFLGEDDNGVITGICNRSAQPDDYQPGFPDDHLCSEQCFWLKSNRENASACQLDDNIQVEYEEYLSAYGATQRGPCMIALGLNRSCVEVFMKMLHSSEKTNESDEIPPLVPTNVIKRNAQYWLKNSKTSEHDKRGPFYPCSHEGSCEDARCTCYNEGVTCEKTCGCDQKCERRFRGCSCARTGRMVCFHNNKCECFLLHRECDPDLCAKCGAVEVLDPFNQDNNAILHGRCGNVGLQRNVPRRTLLGKSEIAGFGLYAGEAIKRNELIGEYKGEILAKGESNRRGAIYHYRSTNYLFKLNSKQEVDSTLAGNKIRFINNADADENKNCYARQSLTDGVIRMGLYARRDLMAGEELFFHYGYPEAATAHFTEKGHVVNAKGVARPVIASKSRARKGNKAKKPRLKAMNSTSLDILGKPGLQLADLSIGGSAEGAISKTETLSNEFVSSSSESEDDDDVEENVMMAFPIVNDDSADEDYREGSVSPSQFVAPARGRRSRKRKASA